MYMYVVVSHFNLSTRCVLVVVGCSRLCDLVLVWCMSVGGAE